MPNRSHSGHHAGTAERAPHARSGRAGAASRNEVFAMLKEDHKRVKKAFRDFEKLDAHEDSEECEALVQETCGLLEVHTMLEEELFYPAARSCLGEEDLIEEAEVEHACAKQLIEQLKGMDPEDEKYAATFKVLGEYIKHHIREEEGEILQQLNRAKLDWQDLEEQMNERRQELMSEILPASAQGAEQGQASEKGQGMSAGEGQRSAQGERTGRGEDQETGRGGRKAQDEEQEEDEE